MEQPAAAKGVVMEQQPMEQKPMEQSSEGGKEILE